MFLAHCAGDPSAFAELVRRWRIPLKRIMSGHCAPDEAEDLVQSVFLHLHRARTDYRAGEPLRPYLLTIAHNLRRDHVRKNRRRSLLAPATDDALRPEAAPPSEAEDPLAEQLHAALGRLPTAQREVIHMHWFDGLPFAAIAARLGASLSAVKVRAHRGYERLRQVISRSDP